MATMTPSMLSFCPPRHFVARGCGSPCSPMQTPAFSKGGASRPVSPPAGGGGAITRHSSAPVQRPAVVLDVAPGRVGPDCCSQGPSPSPVTIRQVGWVAPADPRHSVGIGKIAVNVGVTAAEKGGPHPLRGHIRTTEGCGVVGPGPLLPSPVGATVFRNQRSPPTMIEPSSFVNSCEYSPGPNSSQDMLSSPLCVSALQDSAQAFFDGAEELQGDLQNVGQTTPSTAGSAGSAKVSKTSSHPGRLVQGENQCLLSTAVSSSATPVKERLRTGQVTEASFADSDDPSSVVPTARSRSGTPTPKRREDRFQLLHAEAYARQQRITDRRRVFEATDSAPRSHLNSSRASPHRVKHIVERMASRSEDLLRRRELKQEEARLEQKQREERELQECTFKPVTSSRRPSTLRRRPSTEPIDRALERETEQRLRQLAHKQLDLRARLAQLERDRRWAHDRIKEDFAHRVSTLQAEQHQQVGHFLAGAEGRAYLKDQEDHLVTNGNMSREAARRQVFDELMQDAKNTNERLVEEELEPQFRQIKRDFQIKSRVLVQALADIEARARPILETLQGMTEGGLLLGSSGFTMGLAAQVSADIATGYSSGDSAVASVTPCGDSDGDTHARTSQHSSRQGVRKDLAENVGHGDSTSVQGIGVVPVQSFRGAGDVAAGAERVFVATTVASEASPNPETSRSTAHSTRVNSRLTSAAGSDRSEEKVSKPMERSQPHGRFSHQPMERGRLVQQMQRGHSPQHRLTSEECARTKQQLRADN
eukprot:TRINITY_DN42300_c0_g1_i1.p1 TRINITY_DN42300_c0_g1~~TRINITY_DN42300_c0_g1_i1.p1  ORF type:complete len:887 (+),score=129.66 TRINITY_DN42300_c0_g1_i1:374-2662(+)